MKVFTWKGCLFGCLGVIAILVVGTIGTGFWLTKKGTFEAESTILAPDSEFYLRSYLRREDAVLVDFFTSLANRLNEQNPGYDQFPAFFRNWQKTQSKKDILKLLPLEIEIAMTPSLDRFHASAGFSLYNNLMAVVFYFFKRSVRDEGMVHEHEGVEYVMLNDGEMICLALQDSVFYLANNEEAMKAVLDPRRPATAMHAQDSRLNGLNLDAPLYGYLGGEGCAWNWADDLETIDWVSEGNNNREPIPPEALAFLKNVTRIGFDLVVDDPDTVSGHLLLDTPDRSETMKADIEHALELLSRRDHLKTVFSTESAATGFLVNYKITGFANAAASIIPVR